MDNKFKFQDRDQIDIVESYLGDCAYLFRWRGDKGYAETDKIGKDVPANTKQKIDRTISIILRVDLVDYPTNGSLIRGLIVTSGYGGNTVIAKITLSHPMGMELFNKKIQAAVLLYKDPFPQESLEDNIPLS